MIIQDLTPTVYFDPNGVFATQGCQGSRSDPNMLQVAKIFGMDSTPSYDMGSYRIYKQMKTAFDKAQQMVHGVEKGMV